MNQSFKTSTPSGNYVNNGPITLITDSTEGGAGHAAVRLFLALRRAGHPVELWHFYGNSPPGDGIRCFDGRSHRPTFERILKNFSLEKANAMRRLRHVATLRKALAEHQPRLIHLHNLHACGITPETWVDLFEGFPVVWTMHDCWAYSGDFYPEDAKPIDNPQTSAAVNFWKTKRDCMAVGPSRWICRHFGDVLEESASISNIPLGVDAFTDKTAVPGDCRSALGLKEDSRWVGFCGGNDMRKGGDLLLEASLGLPVDQDIRLLCWGNSIPEGEHGFREIRELGKTSARNELGLRYGACDLMACPSRNDNFPLVVLEALSVGTPVLAGNRGGTAEAIQHGTNGWVSDINPKALRESLIAATQPGLAAGMRSAARESWNTSYTAEREVTDIWSLYSSLMNR